MLDRDACERRVYRLALLLLGDPAAATEVIEAVVRARSELTSLDSPHMDRLTILRSREVKGATTLEHELVPAPLARVLADLPPQAREAWVLARAYRQSARETARAMDCSVTATERHLARADAAFVGGLGDDAATAGETLLQCSLTLDVPPFYRQRRARRRRMRRLTRVAAILVPLAALITLALWLQSRQAGG